ncbi:MAG: RNA polymerase sigma factor [Steroidobacteraceae bacterium]
MSAYPDDKALARRLANGERRAFEQFFADLFPRLYRFVLLRVEHDNETAQDICQQVLERTVRRIDSYRGEASLFTWVCQIARNELADHWERTSRERQRSSSYDQDEVLRHALESLEVDPLRAPEKVKEQSELRLLIQTVLDHLPANYGNALEWKYVEGLDAREIGSRLNLSDSAAHSLLARARRAFRVEFEALAQEIK